MSKVSLKFRDERRLINNFFLVGVNYLFLKTAAVCRQGLLYTGCHKYVPFAGFAKERHSGVWRFEIIIKDDNRSKVENGTI